MYADDDDPTPMLGLSSSVTPSCDDNTVLKGICNQI